MGRPYVSRWDKLMSAGVGGQARQPPHSGAGQGGQPAQPGRIVCEREQQEQQGTVDHVKSAIRIGR